MVRKGDTLTKIAHRFNVSVLQLMQENQLKNKNKLSVGQVLSIPQGGSSAESSLSGEVEPYRVAKGDTLSKIAKRFQISLFELQQMNGFDRNTTLSVGQMILVPRSSTAPTGEDGNYMVQKGDTLGKIAKKFGTTVAKLREQNHLKSDTIYVGQKLYLSGTAPVRKQSSRASAKSDAAPIEGDTYTVQAGDNLYSISRRFSTTTDMIRRLNNMGTSNAIHPGQVIRVQGEVNDEEDSAPVNPGEVVHTVKKGEGLWDIARQYKVTIEEIVRWNGLNDTKVKPGERLKIVKKQ